MGDEEHDHEPDHGGLVEEAAHQPSDAAPGEDDDDSPEDGPELGQLLDASPEAASDGATIDVAGSGEGPLLLDASPDAGPLPPLPPPPPRPAAPTSGLAPRSPTPTQPLARLGGAGAPAGASGGAPAKISRRLGEFYPGEDAPPPAQRPSTKRLQGPFCHVCGAKVEGPRCGRCGEPGRVAGSDAALPTTQARARSTPRAGALGAAVRDRLARESEQRAALAAAAEQLRRREQRGGVLAGLVLQALLGLPVSFLVGPLWLVGLFLLLDAGLGAAAGRRIARREGPGSGQVAAGWAMGAGVGAKLLVGALTSDVSLVAVVAAGGGACLVAAVAGGLLARPAAQAGD